MPSMPRCSGDARGFARRASGSALVRFLARASLLTALAKMAGTRVLALILVLSLVGASAFEETDGALLDHVRKAGGFVGFKIGRASAGGIRGAYADQDYAGEATLYSAESRDSFSFRARTCWRPVALCGEQSVATYRHHVVSLAK